MVHNVAVDVTGTYVVRCDISTTASRAGDYCGTAEIILANLAYKLPTSICLLSAILVV